MKTQNIAPCGLICELCLGYQRKKDKCVGCNNEGYKPFHCEDCSIRNCEEKHGDKKKLCNECNKYPCKRLKNLNKRYETRYGENLKDNFERIKQLGKREFIRQESEAWKCSNCRQLLCVHREICLHCGEINHRFPILNRRESGT
jgi:hypothetical protein